MQAGPREKPRGPFIQRYAPSSGGQRTLWQQSFAGHAYISMLAQPFSACMSRGVVQVGAFVPPLVHCHQPHMVVAGVGHHLPRPPHVKRHQRLVPVYSQLLNFVHFATSSRTTRRSSATPLKRRASTLRYAPSSTAIPLPGCFALSEFIGHQHLKRLLKRQLLMLRAVRIQPFDQHRGNIPHFLVVNGSLRFGASWQFWQVSTARHLLSRPQ